MHRWKLNVFVFILLITATVLLFWGGPDYESARSYKHFWDLGHIIYFALAAYLLSGWHLIARQSLALQWLVILLFTLMAGLLVELVQYGVQRSPEAADVVRDMTGSVLLLSFGPASMLIGSRRWKILLRGTVMALLLLQLAPLAASLLDEAIACARFPVLADFETPLEKGRWRGGEKLVIEQLPAEAGGAALRVPFSTARYSGAGLFYFPGDWTRFEVLEMHVYNPDREPLWVTVRIHDRQHTQGERRYEDRFNRRIQLAAGWNRLEFDLDDVAAAPAGRRLDLGQVRGLGIFTTALPSPRLVYLDDIRLRHRQAAADH